MPVKPGLLLVERLPFSSFSAVNNSPDRGFNADKKLDQQPYVLMIEF